MKFFKIEATPKEDGNGQNIVITSEGFEAPELIGLLQIETTRVINRQMNNLGRREIEKIMEKSQKPRK